MYSNAVGFGGGGRLLSGLSTRGAAGQSAYGQAMAAAAGMNMDRAQKNQQAGVQQMQQQSDIAQANARNRMNAYGNQSQERMKQSQLDNSLGAFNTQMNWNYAGLNRQRQLGMQQMLLNNLAREI